MKKHKDNLLIVTGLSGAGISSTLKHLEDLGYEVFDNFPLSLVGPLVMDSDPEQRPIAIGIDTRSRGFDPASILSTISALKGQLVFLDADETTLQKRFSETRRRHPLAKDKPVSAGIRKEKEWLHTLKHKADSIIDTSMLSIHDLRRVLEERFRNTSKEGLTITLMSFGYKNGTPREADIVVDVRFLNNPYWVPELKPLSGLDSAIAEFIKKDESFEGFLGNFKNLLKPLLPRYAHEGKSYLTIAIGCTGGRHRSVYTAECLKSWISEQNYPTNIVHRDIER
jgi:UPF0042 nucleotide-binding protein